MNPVLARVLRIAGPAPAGIPEQSWIDMVAAGAIAIAEAQEVPNDGTPEEYAAAAIRAALPHVQQPEVVTVTVPQMNNGTPTLVAFAVPFAVTREHADRTGRAMTFDEAAAAAAGPPTVLTVDDFEFDPDSTGDENDGATDGDPWTHGSRLGRDHRSVPEHLVEDHGVSRDLVAAWSDGAVHGHHDGVHRKTWAYAADLTHPAPGDLIFHLNHYDGPNAWQDLIVRSDQVDHAATEAIDPSGMSDRFVTTEGWIVRYDTQTGKWSSTGRYKPGVSGKCQCSTFPMAGGAADCPNHVEGAASV